MIDMASCKQLKTGKWRVSWHVTVKYGSQIGKIIRGSLVFDDKKIAKRFHAQIEVEEDKWRSGMSLPSSGATISWTKLIETFFGAPLGLSDRTREHYKFVFDKFKAFTKEESIPHIDESTIRKFLDNQKTESTRNNHLTPIKSLFSFAYGRGYLDYNPTERIAYAKIGDVTKDPPSRKQMADLLKSTPAPFKWRILLLAHTGLRITEALSIKPEHVLADRIIVQGKGNKKRSVLLDNMARLALKKLGVPVYRAKTKDGINKYARTVWRDCIAKAGSNTKTKKDGKLIPSPIKPLGPHLLRHWFATQLAEAGVDLARISRIIGHENPTLTFRVYIHYADDSPALVGHRRHWRVLFGA
jgi:integrase/recombinase XerD